MLEMKTTLRQALEALGCEVNETEEALLSVNIPEESPLTNNFDKAQCLLALSSEAKPPEAQLVFPGSPLMDQLVACLSEKRAARHARANPQVKISRKGIKDRFEILMGTLERLRLHRIWQTSLKCHFKTTIDITEIKENVFSVEVPPEGPPFLSQIDNDDQPAMEWIKKPPLPINELKRRIEKAETFAMQHALDQAEDYRKESIEDIYTTLYRLNTYYQQLKVEINRNSKSNETIQIDAEYQRRQTEEIENARVKAHVELLAIETLSKPTVQITWHIFKDDMEKKVAAAFDLLTGNLITPVTCENCGKSTERFGLSDSGHLVCPSCHARCDECGAELVSQNAIEVWRCRNDEIRCDSHSFVCEWCHGRIGYENMQQCQRGCQICPDCMVSCVECGPLVTWCPEHVIKLGDGRYLCARHVLVCACCNSPGARSEVITCSICGQTFCVDCSITCPLCGRHYCLNHAAHNIKDHGCTKCQP